MTILRGQRSWIWDHQTQFYPAAGRKIWTLDLRIISSALPHPGRSGRDEDLNRCLRITNSVSSPLGQAASNEIVKRFQSLISPKENAQCTHYIRFTFPKLTVNSCSSWYFSVRAFSFSRLILSFKVRSWFSSSLARWISESNLKIHQNHWWNYSEQLTEGSSGSKF